MSSGPVVPKAKESIISEFLGNIFNITIVCNCKTFVLVLWTLHYDILSTLCHIWDHAGCFQWLYSCQFSKHICCICLRLDQQSSDQRLECICLLEYTNNPVLNHVVPAYQTHQGSAAGTLETHMYMTLVGAFVFYFCLYAVQTDDAKINSHIFFFLLIIQYCNIFNIK